MSKLETNTIDTISGSTNLTLGGTNATDITIPSGVTITNNGTQSGFGGTMTPAFEAYLSSDQSMTDATFTKIQCNTEILDSDGNYDNSTNYRFTPKIDGVESRRETMSTSAIIDFNGSSDYVELFGWCDILSGSLSLEAGNKYVNFGAFKIIE
jgi:hypothetical protein